MGAVADSGLVLGSRSAHKLAEMERLLAPVPVDPLPAAVALPPEDAEDFTAHALAKARAAAVATGRPAIGDDSGILAAALGGRPGVRSARFAGPDADDAANLARLRALAPPGTALEYVCVLALATPDGREFTATGRCAGTLADEPAGSGGFGYDPAFVPDAPGDGRTMAQLADAEKDAAGHRGAAVRELLRLTDDLRALDRADGADASERGAVSGG